MDHTASLKFFAKYTDNEKRVPGEFTCQFLTILFKIFVTLPIRIYRDWYV